MYRVSRYLVVSRVLGVSRVSTVKMLLQDSIPGLNLPLYYVSGFREFLVFEGFQRLHKYTLVEGFKILGILESFQCFKCFKDFKGSILF